MSDTTADILAQIRHDSQETRELVAEIRDIFAQQNKRLERIEATLYGNGHLGLVTKVAAILWASAGITSFVAILLAHAINAWITG